MKTLYPQVTNQLLGERNIPFMATDHEIVHGHNIQWTLREKEAPDHIKPNWHGTIKIAEVVTTGTRDRKPFKATHRFITSLRTIPEALLSLVKERCSLENGTGSGTPN